jgi:hypothetical protein
MLRDKIRAAFVVTCTHHNKDYLVGIGGSDTRTRSRSAIMASTSIASSRTRAPVAIALHPDRGHIAGMQGLPDLIEACRILADRGSRSSAPSSATARTPLLERLIRKKGSEDRIPDHRLSGEHIIPLYQQADVVVLPALSEATSASPTFSSRRLPWRPR